MEGGAPATADAASTMEGVVTSLLPLLVVLMACFEAGKYTAFPQKVVEMFKILHTSLESRQKIVVAKSEKVDAKRKNLLAKKLNIHLQKLQSFLRKHVKDQVVDDTTLLQDLLNCFTQLGTVGRGDLKWQPKKEGVAGEGKTIECPITEEEFSPKDPRIVFRTTRRDVVVFCAGTYSDALECVRQIFSNEKVVTVNLSLAERTDKYGKWEMFSLFVEMHNGLVFRSTTTKLWKMCVGKFGKLTTFGNEVQNIIENAIRREVAKENSNARKLLFCPCKTCKFASYGFTCGTPTVKEVKCPQGHKMCPKCGDNAHSGICAKIPGMDDETLKLLRADSKECPVCSLVITRIDGCNHMQCPCGTHFCWRCGEVLEADTPYAGHRGCAGLDTFGHPVGQNAGGGAYQ